MKTWLDEPRSVLSMVFGQPLPTHSLFKSTGGLLYLLYDDSQNHIKRTRNKRSIFFLGRISKMYSYTRAVY